MAPRLRAWRFWMWSPISVSDSTVRKRAPPGTNTGYRLYCSLGFPAAIMAPQVGCGGATDKLR